MAAEAFIYDSDARRTVIATELRNVWNYRGLLRLLVARDLTVRYKRSYLGVGWSVLNPLLTSAVMWVVFSQIFRFSTPGVPFVVYVLSGVLLVTFFTQSVLAASGAIVNSASILTKVFVPAEVFSLAAAIAGATNFAITLVPLLLAQIVTGVGIPWTVLLVPLPVLALMCFIVGLGLLVASAAAAYHDVMDLTAVVMQLATYLTPAFYPIEIIPPQFLPLVRANPLYSYLLVFRGFIYEGQFAPWWAFAVVGGTAVGFLAVGVFVFSRTWKRLVVVL